MRSSKFLLLPLTDISIEPYKKHFKELLIWTTEEIFSLHRILKQMMKKNDFPLINALLRHFSV
jgi:hypothetical protein